MRIPTSLFAIMAAAFLAASPALAAIMVPEGNQSDVQPPVPSASAKRTAETNGTYELKYQKILKVFESDPALREKIKRVAAQYDINPLHIVGAIVGEHTYNVDIYDTLQTYYVKALSYFGQAVSFSFEGESIEDFVHRPQFAACAKFTGSYELWSCRETIWNSVFRGHVIGGKAFPDNRFSAVFFQPFYAGQTFGLGQLNPLTALEMTDMVHRISGLPKLEASDGRTVYKTIMDPDSTLPYIAAVIRKSIDLYRDIAGFDISDNPGLTSTLYNTGEPEARARALAAENERRKAAGEPLLYPKENYYGWFVNEKIGDFRPYFGALADQPGGMKSAANLSAR